MPRSSVCVAAPHHASLPAPMLSGSVILCTGLAAITAASPILVARSTGSFEAWIANLGLWSTSAAPVIRFLPFTHHSCRSSPMSTLMSRSIVVVMFRRWGPRSTADCCFHTSCLPSKPGADRQCRNVHTRFMCRRDGGGISMVKMTLEARFANELCCTCVVSRANMVEVWPSNRSVLATGPLGCWFQGSLL